MPCPVLPCHVLPCSALLCPALPCTVTPCPALLCQPGKPPPVGCTRATGLRPPYPASNALCCAPVTSQLCQVCWLMPTQLNQSVQSDICLLPHSLLLKKGSAPFAAILKGGTLRCTVQIIAAVEKSAKTLGLSQKRLVSRAYHDSLFMAQIAPAGMIFVPCKNGWSHRPDEFTSAQNIENGVKTLALTLAELAGTAPDSRTEL